MVPNHERYASALLIMLRRYADALTVSCTVHGFMYIHCSILSSTSRVLVGITSNRVSIPRKIIKLFDGCYIQVRKLSRETGVLFAKRYWAFMAASHHFRASLSLSGGSKYLHRDRKAIELV
jgi:hypothetical protein